MATCRSWAGPNYLAPAKSWYPESVSPSANIGTAIACLGTPAAAPLAGPPSVPELGAGVLAEGVPPQATSITAASSVRNRIAWIPSLRSSRNPTKEIAGRRSLPTMLDGGR